ncbi:hypothetical protein [uncultured Oscillibacter sp.]|uniref:hypothetical protein n=1 Tax=uncultured Oscillibacter sp. TaxID=876091 RepID=UPI0025D16203|nr:hypothetical protein [uncultured Oscillibacter sp.]
MASIEFAQTTQSITLNTATGQETTVATLTQAVEENQLLKIDYAIGVGLGTNASSAIGFDAILYRDGTQIAIQEYEYALAEGVAFTILVSNTFVDTAPATSAASTYEVRISFENAVNLDSAISQNFQNINIITFDP